MIHQSRCDEMVQTQLDRGGWAAWTICRLWKQVSEETV